MLTPSSGLSQRAGHPLSQLHLLHGSLFDIRCTDFYCDYAAQNDFTDPVTPALAIPTAGDDSGNGKSLDISDVQVPLKDLTPEDLPHCPKCKTGILRPGVVWFGEPLPSATLDIVDDWCEQPERIDLILVIGTSAKVYPAAEYVDIARAKGAKVAVINMNADDIPANGLEEGDWFFEGDAGIIVPDILKSVIGEI